MLGFAVEKQDSLAEMLSPCVPLVVNVLRAGQRPLAEHFLTARQDAQGDPGASFSTAGNGSPYLEQTPAILESACSGVVESGHRRLFVSGIASARMLSDGQPLTLRQAGLEL